MRAGLEALKINPTHWKEAAVRWMENIYHIRATKETIMWNIIKPDVE